MVLVPVADGESGREREAVEVERVGMEGGWEEMMGLVGLTGETAIERGVGEEEMGVGVEGVLLPPFCRGG